MVRRALSADVDPVRNQTHMWRMRGISLCLKRCHDEDEHEANMACKGNISKVVSRLNGGGGAQHGWMEERGWNKLMKLRPGKLNQRAPFSSFPHVCVR